MKLFNNANFFFYCFQCIGALFLLASTPFAYAQVLQLNATSLPEVTEPVNTPTSTSTITKASPLAVDEKSVHSNLNSSLDSTKSETELTSLAERIEELEAKLKKIKLMTEGVDFHPSARSFIAVSEIFSAINICFKLLRWLEDELLNQGKKAESRLLHKILKEYMIY